MNHPSINRRFWNAYAREWVERGRQAWASEEPYWGIWSIPQADVALLDDDLSGCLAVELGCGTGYVSRWMERRGAEVFSLDVSDGQLRSAEMFKEANASGIHLIHGNAEQLPFNNESVDYAVSEYGAAIWCDPYRWVPEAARVLKQGGRLRFWGHSPWAMICLDANDEVVTHVLRRSYFGLHRLDFTEAAVDPGGVEFNLPISDWLQLFAESGLFVERFLEIKAPASAHGEEFGSDAEWAKRFPSEQAWWLRKVSPTANDCDRAKQF